MGNLVVITHTSGIHQTTSPNVNRIFYKCDDDKKVAEFVELSGQILCDHIMKTVDKFKNSKIVDVDYDISAPGFIAEYYVNGIRNTDSVKVLDEPVEITSDLLDELRGEVDKFRFKKDYIMDKFMEINERLLEEKE